MRRGVLSAVVLMLGLLIGVGSAALVLARGVQGGGVRNGPWTTNLAIGSAESLIPLFLAFGCLTVAWLCVAAGLRRTAD